MFFVSENRTRIALVSGIIITVAQHSISHSLIQVVFRIGTALIADYLNCTKWQFMWLGFLQRTKQYSIVYTCEHKRYGFTLITSEYCLANR